MDLKTSNRKPQNILPQSNRSENLKQSISEQPGLEIHADAISVNEMEMNKQNKSDIVGVDPRPPLPVTGANAEKIARRKKHIELLKMRKEKVREINELTA